LRNRETDFQIELVELQMDHEFLTSSFMGSIAILFGILFTLASIFYGLIGQSAYYLISIVIIIVMFGLVAVIRYMLQRYVKERKKLKDRINELKKEYAW